MILQRDLFDPFRITYLSDDGMVLGHSIKSNGVLLVTRLQDGITRECSDGYVEAFLTHEKPVMNQFKMEL